jgi:hypothetical protein
VAVLLFLGLHLLALERRGAELVLVAGAGLLGFVADSALVLLGVLHFQEGT